MLSETIEFNVSVLVARDGPNGKSAFFPLITCSNESVEIVTVGVTVGSTERWRNSKSNPVRLIIVKNPGRGRVDVEPATERGRVGSDCFSIHVESGIKVMS